MTGNFLVDGDPLDPQCSDVIAEIRTLEVGKSLPIGWRVLTGNNKSSVIGRVVLRYEVEE